MTSGPKQIERAGALWMILASSMLAVISFATPALSQDAAPLSQNPAAQSAANVQPPPGENNQGVYPDPLSGFNEPMFTFNLKLDDWVLRPVARGYATIAPQPVRESVAGSSTTSTSSRVSPITCFSSSWPRPATKSPALESTRRRIGRLLRSRRRWFGLEEHPNDFGLTIRYYGIPTGPYMMLPFFGPSTVGDTVGLVADGAMNPMSYLVPSWITSS